MRKTSYFVAFLAVSATLALSVLSIVLPDWLYVHPPDIFHTRTIIRYGLLERCERQTIDFPGPGENGRIRYTDYKCRAFPTKKDDACEDEKRLFCTLWSTAGYIAELSIAFGAATLIGIIVGVSTRSRRRRVWRAVVGLETLHAACKIVTFSIISELYRDVSYPSFEYARPSTAYVLNTVSWAADILIVLGVVVTGLAADAGHKWAAGNRAYRPIPDHHSSS